MRLLTILAASLCWACAGTPAPPTVTASVASSLSDVIGDLARRYETSHGVRVQLNLAASNTLARQIVDGAPVDLFLSADVAQMGVVANAGRIVANTHTALLTNQLVVITPPNTRVTISDPKQLADPAVRRLAMGQPDAVPAGVYARQWLETIGLWGAVESKVVPMPTVRAALAAVREGRADAAIVYITDTRSAPELRIAHAVSLADGPRIVYPAAVIRGKNEKAAREFLEYLQSPEARAVYQAAGFGIAP